jgi:hypothetical protein
MRVYGGFGTGPFVPEMELWVCPLDGGKFIAISERKLNFPAGNRILSPDS